MNFVNPNMRVIQAVATEQERIHPNVAIQRIALFGPDGKPLLLTGSSEDVESMDRKLSHLKGRVTKLENRLKEFEGD